MTARNTINHNSFPSADKFHSSSTTVSESVSGYSTSSYSSSASQCSLSSSSSSVSNSHPISSPIFNVYKEDYCNVIPSYLIQASKPKKKTTKKEDESNNTNRRGYSRLRNDFEDEDTKVQKKDKGPEKNQWSKMIWEKLTKKEKNKKKEEELPKLSNPTNPISNLATSDETRANSREDIVNKGYTHYKVMWICTTCNLLNKALPRSCEKCHMPRVAGEAVWV